MKYLFSCLLFFSIGQTFAQDSTVIYYDKDWKVQDWKIDAIYFRVQKIESKTNLINVKDYWITGEIQMVGSFISNTNKDSKNGEFIYYKRDGTIDWQVGYLNGKKHGIEKEWYGLDTIFSIEYYINGKLDGESLSYYENGDLMAQEFYDQGNEIGIATSWFEDGKIESITKFNVSNIDSVYYWYNNGEKELEGTLFDSEVESVKYGNYWDTDGTQIIVNGKGYLILESNNQYWKGPIVDGLYHGNWYKYKKQKGSTWGGYSIGKMKFNAGNFKNGHLYFQGKKVKLNGDWTKSPEFPGGQKGLSTFIGRTLGGCRSEIIPNTVYVEFVVRNDGSISEIQIVSGKTTKCQEENIYKMFNDMPTWTPGIQLGKFVHVRYTVPIKYRAQN